MQETGLSLPNWLREINAGQRRFATLSEAMSFTLDVVAHNCGISGENREEPEGEGGGPFGAVVLDADLKLVAAGANRVVPSQASIYHAEMVALLLAQQRLGSHDLGARGDYTLVTSCAPCAMCLGAIPFAGVRRVVCGARGEDAEGIGFDEGDKPDRWADRLRARGIAVEEDLCRERAVMLFEAYRALGGAIY